MCYIYIYAVASLVCGVSLLSQSHVGGEVDRGWQEYRDSLVTVDDPNWYIQSPSQLEA